jgi:hypothetical protein
MTSASPLIFLPRDILSFVANYFLTEAEQNKKVFKFPYDWRNFLNSSKEYLDSQLIVVSGSHAENFYYSLDFREKFYGLIENPRLRLDLIFRLDNWTSKNPLVIDLNSFNRHVQKVEIFRYPIIPSIVDMDEVVFYMSEFLDLSCFSHFEERHSSCQSAL